MESSARLIPKGSFYSFGDEHIRDPNRGVDNVRQLGASGGLGAAALSGRLPVRVRNVGFSTPRKIVGAPPPAEIAGSRAAGLSGVCARR